MKIEQVKIQEFKKLKNIEADLNGKNFFIVGENGVGKSSFLQFIEIALGKTNNIPPDAQGSGVVIASKDGGQYTFKVKFKDNKPVIEITSPDGLKDTRKGTLAAITGAIDFNIDEFVNLSNSKAGQKKQVEIFKSFLSQDIIDELNRMEAHVATLYNERTDANRLLKEYETFCNSHPLRHEMDLSKFKEVDINAAFENLTKIQESNKKVEAVVKNVQSEIQKVSDANAEIERLKELIARQEEIVKASTENIHKGEEWLKVNKIADTTAIEETIKSAQETNLKFTQAQELIKKRGFLKEVEATVESLTVRIETERQMIVDAIKDMESPVEGLSYNEDCLVYNEIPVNDSSLSTSEIIELGVKLKMAENKEFGVLFIEHGESLGTQRLKDIIEMAEKNNFQLLVEEVRRGVESLNVELMAI